jgi:hypothetical protein
MLVLYSAATKCRPILWPVLGSNDKTFNQVSNWKINESGFKESTIDQPHAPAIHPCWSHHVGTAYSDNWVCSRVCGIQLHFSWRCCNGSAVHSYQQQQYKFWHRRDTEAKTWTTNAVDCGESGFVLRRSTEWGSHLPTHGTSILFLRTF